MEKDKPVLVAGDNEKSNMSKADKHNGIQYHINQIKFVVRNNFKRFSRIKPIIIFLFF